MKFFRKAAAILFVALVGSGTAVAGPMIEMKTSLGPITIELYPEKAPKSVENFLQYVKDGFFKGTIFHRVIPGFMAQGGGFTTEFQQKDTREPVRNEADNGLKNTRGTLAMARTQNPHSATAQFFVNVADNGFLDHTAPNTRGWGYAVFGKVVKGMDVVDAIVQVPTGDRGPFQNVPITPVVIEDARIVNN
jgi:cyclophilin family peptidyl-prolyl cis-trans isomerase